MMKKRHIHSKNAYAMHKSTINHACQSFLLQESVCYTNKKRRTVHTSTHISKDHNYERNTHIIRLDTKVDTHHGWHRCHTGRSHHHIMQ